MAQKINVNLPESVIIGDGWTVEWDAVDPTTGASVSGVKVSNANVTATDLSVGEGTGVATNDAYLLVLGSGA